VRAGGGGGGACGWWRGSAWCLVEIQIVLQEKNGRCVVLRTSTYADAVEGLLKRGDNACSSILGGAES
jgi:hypothetical protein